MKTFFKRSAVSLIVAGLTSLSYAAVPTQSMNGVFVGIEALNLRPMNGDLDYYEIEKNNGGWDVRNISTDHDWGFRLFGGVTFGDNDDVTVSWFRIRNSSSDYVDFNGVDNYVRYISGSAYDAARAKVTFDLDEVYAVLGHTIHFNNPWSVRFAGGLAYARLDSDLRTAVTSGGNSNYSSATDNVTLKGWGPRAEFDMNYHIASNVALFANTNATLLVSNRDVDTNFFDSNGDYYEGYHFSGRNVVVPKFGMRLGASYTHGFGQAGAEGGGSAVTVSAGWQVESYVHAIERYDDSSGYIENTKTSNFGDHGLFLGVTFHSNWM